MSEAQNTKVVQDAYAAFGRGDIPVLLGYMTDKAAVGEFFRQVAEAEDFQQFEPRSSSRRATKVVALGHYRAVTKARGKTFDADFVMVFTLRGGKVAAFQEFSDSAGINAAFA